MGGIEIAKDYPAWVLAFTIGGVLALALWTMSRSQEPPKWQTVGEGRSNVCERISESMFSRPQALAYMGFIVSVIWIYIIANEVVNVLQVRLSALSDNFGFLNSRTTQTLGRMFGISDAILGLTVLAWGNSVSDFVANVAVARSGAVWV